MAERTVTVRLRALVDDYKRQMASAGKATADVAAQGEKWKTLGQSTARLGDSLTRNVTLPIVAVGAAATKMALDFDQTFVRMQALAGVSADEVDGLKQAVLGLAGETGRAPQELAEALYFIRSAGLDGQAALDALEVSAKAAAIGMGSTADVANAVTSAMNAYGAGSLTAAEATDTLVAAVTEGKVAASELAPQFGRLLPVAAELGISFQDVSAGLAFLTRSSGDASQSATSLAGVMNKLLKPSQQGAEALAAVGLSTDSIRQSIAEQGLLATLQMLRDQLGDVGFNRVFEDAEALRGALQLTGADAAEVEGVFQRVNDSTGALASSFETWAESMGSKNARAWAEFQASLIRLGDVIAPIAANIMDAVGGIADAFGNLPGPLQTAIVYTALFVAAIGPVLSIGGRIMQAHQAITRMATAVGGLGRAAGVAGGAAGLAGMLLVIDQIGKARTAERVDELTESFLAGKVGAEEMAEALNGTLFEAGDLDGVFDKLVDSNIEGAKRFMETAEAAGATAEQLEYMRDAIEQKATADAQSAADAKTNADAVDEQAAAMEGAADATEDATSALKDYADQLRAQFDPLFGMVDALHDNAEAQAAVTEAQDALNDAIAEHGKNSDEAKAAQEALTEAHRQASGTALDVVGAMAQLNDAIAANPALLESSKAQLQTWVDQGLITQETADAMGREFDITAMKAVALGDTDPNVKVTETGGSRTRGTLDKVQQAAINAGRQKPNVQVRATDRASGVLGFIRSRINELPTNKTVTVTALYRESGLASSTLGQVLKRQHGGPVAGGQLYEVAEQGRAELLEMGGRTYLIPGADGHVVAASQWQNAISSGAAHAATSAGGRMDMTLHVTGNGALAEQVQRSIRTGEIQLRVGGERVRVG